MISSYHESDVEVLMGIWRRSSGLAHPFLQEDFVAQVESDIREKFLPIANTSIYKILKKITPRRNKVKIF